MNNLVKFPRKRWLNSQHEKIEPSRKFKQRGKSYRRKDRNKAVFEGMMDYELLKRSSRAN